MVDRGRDLFADRFPCRWPLRKAGGSGQEIQDPVCPDGRAVDEPARPGCAGQTSLPVQSARTHALCVDDRSEGAGRVL